MLTFPRRSSMLVKDVTYACACVPHTGTLNNFPAKTLLVPSNPPVTEHVILN